MMGLSKRSRRFHHPRMGPCTTFGSRRTCFVYLFFQMVSADGPAGKIHGAGSFGNRTVDLGHRAELILTCDVVAVPAGRNTT